MEELLLRRNVSYIHLLFVMNIELLAWYNGPDASEGKWGPISRVLGVFRASSGHLQCRRVPERHMQGHEGVGGASHIKPPRVQHPKDVYSRVAQNIRGVVPTVYRAMASLRTDLGALWPIWAV